MTGKYDKEKDDRVLFNDVYVRAPWSLLWSSYSQWSGIAFDSRYQIWSLELKMMSTSLFEDIFAQNPENQLGRCLGGYQVQQTIPPYKKDNYSADISHLCLKLN